MTLPVSASTRLLALLGDPVSHSLSPTFQNAALRTMSLNAVYLALRCSPQELPGLLRGIAAAGGAGNVTVPHKEATARLLDDRTTAVARTGACNTFWAEEGKLVGDNTDVHGVRMAIRTLLGRDPRGGRVLLLGAGGAARAALCAIVEENVREVTIVNRTRERAEMLRSVFEHSGVEIRVADSFRGIEKESFDLAINATSLGLRASDPLPVEVTRLGSLGAGLDLVYAADETRWTHHLRAHGVAAADGLEMLLHQGAASFERWWGLPAPLEVMRGALPRRR